MGDSSALVHELRSAVEGEALSPRIVACMAGAVVSEQIALAHLLGWLGGEVAIASLMELLYAEPTIAKAASDALRRLGPDANPFVVDALGRADSGGRLRLLPLVGYGRASVQNLALCLDDPDPTVRVLACDTLARAGNTSVVPALFRLIGDRDPAVSQAAGTKPPNTARLRAANMTHGTRRTACMSS